MEPIEFRPKRWKLAMLMLAGFGFVALGVFLVRDYGTSHSIKALLAGIASVVFFLPISFIILWRIVSPQAQIVFSDEGLLLQGQGGRPYPWHTIKAAYVAQIKTTSFVALELENEAELAAQASTWRRMIIGLNRGMGFGRVNISVTALGISAEQLCRMILERVHSARRAQAADAARFGWSAGDRR